MDRHDEQVSQISDQVSSFYKASTSFRVYHGTTNSTRPSSRTHQNTIDTSKLNHVLSVDTSSKTCVVEPNVPMDVLIAETLKHNLVPPVIPEFPGITVGGAFAGTAGESSSFRHGFFEDCINWIEVVLADGEVVVASDHEHGELFHGSKGTFGTLGLATLLEVRLVDAKKFVEVKHEIVTRGIDEAKDFMLAQCRKDDQEVQFVDGIMFSKNLGVIVVGRMTDGEPSESSIEDAPVHLPVVTFSKSSDQWYYLHIEDILNFALKQQSHTKKTKDHHELIPLRDYLFRYDRGAFWTGRHAFSYFLTPFNKMTRWALDGFMHTRTMFHALHRSGLMQKFIIQDMAVPWENVEAFHNWLHDSLDIYPLWLAPLKLGKGGIRPNPGFLNGLDSPNRSSEFMLNVGVWGFSPRNPLAVNRQIEKKLLELKGTKWLYSQTFYTEDEFWSIYDREWYKELRARYNAETLPDVYEKVGGTARNQHDGLTGIWKIWPLAGLYGVMSTLKGGDYLRKR